MRSGTALPELLLREFDPTTDTCRVCKEVKKLDLFSTARPLKGRRCLACVAVARERVRAQQKVRDRRRAKKAQEAHVAFINKKSPLPLPEDWDDRFLDALSGVLHAHGLTSMEVFGKQPSNAGGNYLPQVRVITDKLSRHNIRLSEVVLKAEEGYGW